MSQARGSSNIPSSKRRDRKIQKERNSPIPVGCCPLCHQRSLCHPRVPGALFPLLFALCPGELGTEIRTAGNALQALCSLHSAPTRRCWLEWVKNLTSFESFGKPCLSPCTDPSKIPLFPVFIYRKSAAFFRAT